MIIPSCDDCHAVLYHLIRERHAKVKQRESLELNITGYDGSTPNVGYSAVGGIDKEYLRNKGGGGRRYIYDENIVNYTDYSFSCPYCGSTVDIEKYGWYVSEAGQLESAEQKMEKLL